MPVLIPPWKKQSEWRELHKTLAALISSREKGLADARTAARNIRMHLVDVALPMENLCLETCRFCPGVCCRAATVWADFKDALFWHLAGQNIPPAQNLSRAGQTCRYLGAKGCTLPRLSRPFMCTWYICPTQVSRLRNLPQSASCTKLKMTLQTIKDLRTEMENAFICAVL
ncbi:MAG: hypothetical protein LJE94_01825 [Deltaproteobacteria bacterium]|nr:hypothetical protein [Deltaproteobacteria bacterium]